MADQNAETRARALHGRLAAVTSALKDPTARAADVRKARDALSALSDEAAALAERAGSPAVHELVAEILYEKAETDFGYSQGSTWFVLHPQLERVAAVGAASQRPRGLEVAAWAHLRMGECLVDPDDPEESPNDRRWGGQQLQEAIRLGREAGTREGLLHAARAGLRLSEVMQQQGDRQAASGLRAGVCATRERALASLDTDAATAFDRALADLVGEDPAAWCAKHRES